MEAKIGRLRVTSTLPEFDDDGSRAAIEEEPGGGFRLRGAAQVASLVLVHEQDVQVRQKWAGHVEPLALCIPTGIERCRHTPVQCVAKCLHRRTAELGQRKNVCHVEV